MAKGPAWTEDELEYLSSAVGVKTAATISRVLGRSLNACKIARYRKLGGVSQWVNVLTASAVAKEVGVS